MIASILPTYNRTPMNFISGKGSWLTTDKGECYLDLGAGIAVNCLGHAHPALVTALTQQANTLWHTSNLYGIPQQQDLADHLVAKTFADTVFFTNSGTEACELAVKMARKYWFETGRPEKTDILGFEGAFHGRSSAGIAAAGSEKMTHGFGPILPGFKNVAFNDIAALEAAITKTTGAIMIEPIQGEGGIRPVDIQFMNTLRDLCDTHDILLVLDEVQCGVGRTGKLFAHEHYGITPDIMLVAKGIGGGFPLGAVLATQNAAKGMTAGTHGSTYGGNPLGCAVGNCVLDIIANDTFLKRVNEKAAYFKKGLETLMTQYPNIFETVQGVGLMLGLKCKIPNTDIIAACYAQNLLTVLAGDNVIRLLPPLNISQDDIDEALKRLTAAAQNCSP